MFWHLEDDGVEIPPGLASHMEVLKRAHTGLSIIGGAGEYSSRKGLAP